MIAEPKTRVIGPAAGMLFACLATFSIAACDRPRIEDGDHPLYTDPAQRHPIVVGSETVVLELALEMGGSGAEAQAYIQTTRYLRRYRQDGRSLLTIAMPRGAGRAGSERMRGIRTVMGREGIPPHRVRTVDKPEGGSVTLTYERIAAIGPACGDWSEDVTRNPERLPYPNYGCASQRNLAAMVANPTDAAFPTREVARQSDRRATVYKTFTTTPPPPLGSVSTATPR